jgi:RNA-directed DNA polymerase
MEVPYGEGIAGHTGPESCGGARESAAEALTGERAGWVLSREILDPRETGVLRGADAVRSCGRQHRTCRKREARTDPARSETPRMHGSISHGSREIPRPAAEVGVAVRAENPKGARRR